MVIECDNCSQNFEPTGLAPGADRTACPHCGDINRLPVQEQASSGATKTESLGSDERQLLHLRRAMFRARPLAFSLMIVLLVISVAAGIYGIAADDEASWMRDAVAYLGVLGLLAGLIWWGVWYIGHLSESIRVTSHRTMHRKGLLARHTNEVLHSHVRNLRIEQSFFQRLTGVGRIVLDSSAGGSDPTAEISVSDVPGPFEVKKIIDQHRGVTRSKPILSPSARLTG